MCEIIVQTKHTVASTCYPYDYPQEKMANCICALPYYVLIANKYDFKYKTIATCTYIFLQETVGLLAGFNMVIWVCIGYKL